MATKPRGRWKVGDIVSIARGESRVGFAWVLDCPLMAFFDRTAYEGDLPTAEDGECQRRCRMNCHAAVA